MSIASHTTTFLAGFGVGVLACGMLWLRYVLGKVGGREP